MPAVQPAGSADSITVAALGTVSCTDDEARLAALGYKQQLKRDLSLFTNFALSFTIVSILTGLTGEQLGVAVQSGRQLPSCCQVCHLKTALMNGRTWAQAVTC
jgi:hypothetical protein